MEEQKYIKKKRKALNGSNRKYLAEACTELGDYYNKCSKYEKALDEYKESANIYSSIEMKLEFAKSNRMIGEMYMLLAEFEKALQCENVYLSIVRELNNEAEEQRALATLGRAFLLKGQSLSEVELSKAALQSAQKAFMQSLSLCDRLKGKINTQELMDMRARLLLNIGVVLEHLEDFEKAINYIRKAISICKNQDLHELLCQCYITEGLLYSSKKNDHSKGIAQFNFALEVASRLENKVIKQCEILYMKAESLCKISDFQSAKVILIKAWKMKTPNEFERNEIERTLKIVAALCYTEDLLVTTNSENHSTLKMLYEKMGDGACWLKNYNKAIQYYLKMLENAEKCGDTDKALIPIYISLYQTYKDLSNYDKALEYNKKEFEIVKHNPKEACGTLLNMAEILNLLGQSYNEIETVLTQAKNEARKEGDKKLEAKSIKMLMKYQIDIDVDKQQQLENELELLGDVANKFADSSDDDCSEDGLTPNIGDDICLEDLTDISDNEENINPTTRRKRGKGFSIKKNSKGETQLHQACISGNMLLVTRLISQGHPVNVRDNAGWLPIHEACIHGHKLIVEELIKNGAHINDRGGTQCDGITPIYDAASNGHIEIVDLLLNHGASSGIKTDGGDTPLDVLIKWREGNRLDPVDHIYYETVCGRMKKNLDKIGVSSKRGNSFKTLLKEPRGSNQYKEMQPTNSISDVNTDVIDDPTSWNKRYGAISCSSSDDDGSNSPQVVYKSRNAVDDSSDASDDIGNVLSKQKSDLSSGVNAYKNAINGLKNKNIATESNKDKSKTRSRKSALLDPEEVGEDWLEDDFIQSRNKRRRPENEFLNPSKRRSNESIKSNNINNSENPIQDSIDLDKNLNLNLDVNSVSIECYDTNSDDSQHFHSSNVNKSQNREVSPKKGLSISSRKWKRQSSLIKSGFSRKKTSRLNIHTSSAMLPQDHGSDSDTSSNRRFSEEPDSTSEPILSYAALDRLSAFRMTGNIENVAMNNFNASGNCAYSPSKATQPPVTVKVRVQEKLLLIPIITNNIESLTISWLSKEVSKRYYNIEGVQPFLHLLTTDGAILADDDPLSIIIGSSELQANITSWNLPPLGDRYIECCKQMNICIDEVIKSLLEASQATHILEFTNLNLTSSDMKPVFKALNHQANLKSLLLSNNSLGNDGMKALNQCLLTLTNISSINLSGNMIDFEGIQDLQNIFEKSNRQICEHLQELDLSFNSIDSIGFSYFSKLTKYLNLKSLNLKACDINCTNTLSIKEMNLRYVENLNISYNSFDKNVIEHILQSLNTEIIVFIDLSNLKLSGDLVSDFFDRGSFIKLKEFNLSRCGLTDADVSQILRSSSKCANLEKMHLCYNDDLSFLSLKKLLQQNIKHINLEGCDKIFKYMQESDLQSNWFIENNNTKIETIKLTPGKSYIDMEEILINFSMMWSKYWNHNGTMQKQPFNKLFFTKE